MKCGGMGILMGIGLGQNWPEGIQSCAGIQSSERSSSKHLPQGLSRRKFYDSKQPLGCDQGSGWRHGRGIWSTATELLIDKAPCQWVGRELLRC